METVNEPGEKEEEEEVEVNVYQMSPRSKPVRDCA
jgi:hypothetical protein